MEGNNNSSASLSDPFECTSQGMMDMDPRDLEIESDEVIVLTRKFANHGCSWESQS